MMENWLAILGALGGWEAIKWCISSILNRTTNARKEKASAGSMEIDNQKKQVDWLEERLAQRDLKIDGLYIELRNVQNEKTQLIFEKHSIELELKEASIKRCDIRGCEKRQPPSDY